MELGLATVLPNIIFFLLDLIILGNSQLQKNSFVTQKLFSNFALSVLLQQGCSTLYLLSYYNFIHLGKLALYIIFSVMFICMTGAAYYWFMYFLYTISEIENKTKLKEICCALPLIIMSITSISSPWTHWIMYLDQDNKYVPGSIFFLQLVCPYLYLLMALAVSFNCKKKKEKPYLKKMVRNFLGFVIPSFAGAYIQIWILKGGYTQIGISICFILIYLELYMEEVNENRRLKSVEALNYQLQQLNEEQEAQLLEISSLNAELEKNREKSDAANNAKTMFLNNMSHDIRTPMNAILGFAELLEREKNNPEQVSDYVKKIRNSGEYLLNIINSILDMAKIESGNATVDYSIMDLKNAEDVAIAALEDMMKKKNQTFKVTNTIQHRYVMLDCAKHQQITMNLLSNANKYTPEGGEIHMHMDEIPCGREGYSTYRMRISDNGIGMSPEYVNHVFDSFSREKNTTESKVIGTGLGMSIVKKLVDLLEGTIEVESQVGKGTTFTVTFDHKLVSDEEISALGAEKKDDDIGILEGKRILLAEDNDVNAEIATELLKTRGIIVERADDGVECIDMLMKAPEGYYSVILMDIQMPNLNGYDATKKIRLLSDTKKASIPILAMTANAFEEDRMEAMNAGMNGHLAKPINIGKMMDMLVSVVK